MVVPQIYSFENLAYEDVALLVLALTVFGVLSHFSLPSRKSVHDTAYTQEQNETSPVSRIKLMEAKPENSFRDSDEFPEVSKPTDAQDRTAALTYDPLCGPCPRVGCPMVLDKDSGIIIIGCGVGAEKIESEMCAFVTCTGTWIHFPQSYVSLAYASMVASRGRLYLFGGINDKLETNATVYGYDFDDKKWEPLGVGGNGNSPAGRFNCSLCEISADQFVLFGGRGCDGSLFNDVWSMDISDPDCITWERLDDFADKCAPCPREAHSVVMRGSCMLVLGGSSELPEPQSNDFIHVFDIDQRVWLKNSVVGDGPGRGSLVGGSAHRMGRGSEKVLVVSGVSSTVVDETTNSTSEDQDSCFVSDVFNSIFILDMSTEPYRWSRVAVEWIGGGDATMPPGTRCFHGSSFDEDSGILYLCGGLGSGLREGEAMGGMCTVDCSDLMMPLSEEDPGNSDGEEEDFDGEYFVNDGSPVTHEHFQTEAYHFNLTCTSGEVSKTESGCMFEERESGCDRILASVAPLSLRNRSFDWASRKDF